MTMGLGGCRGRAICPFRSGWSDSGPGGLPVAGGAAAIGSRTGLTMADTRGQNGTECSRPERPKPRPRPSAGRGRLDSKLPIVSAAAWLMVLAADVGVEGGSSLLVDMMTDVVATLRVVGAAAEEAVDMVVVDAVVVSWPTTGPTGTDASTASDSNGGLGSPSTVGGTPIK